MAKGRFVEVYTQGITNVEKIIVDTQTGINDLLASSTLTAGCGMSILVGADGNPLATPIDWHRLAHPPALSAPKTYYALPTKGGEKTTGGISMASERKIMEYAQQAGYQPLEDHCIIVKPAPGNLSDKIVSFFKSIVKCDLCVLQMCEDELILLPFDPMWVSLQEDVSLILPYGDIQSVELEDDLLNTIITIRAGEDVIRLTTQQKALSDWRMSGLNATQYAGGYKNWHKENLDRTLEALKKIGYQA